MAPHLKLIKKNLFRSNRSIIIFIAILTAFASEIKIVPFEGETFRFGLGSVVFFLLILVLPQVSLLKTGVYTGIMVVSFRLFVDIFFGHILLSKSILTHLPAFLFYLIFSLGLYWVKVERYKSSPFILSVYAAIIEFLGNGTEELTRSILVHQTKLDITDWTLIAGVAIIRNVFAVGLYSSIKITEKEKRMQEMLKIGSDLYGETLYLQKSMNHIEQITAKSYELYRKLKKQESQELSNQALHIAQEIHEVKKDSQRILSGLVKLSFQKKVEILFLSDLVNLIVSSNEKYSDLLKKKIKFHMIVSFDYETDKQIPLLAILNNLAANAVESIEDIGEIYLEVLEKSHSTCFFVKDTGKGIPKEDLSIIFEPGYTTKFNDHGVAATGIGLSYVEEIVRTLNGQIQIETSKMGTVFQVNIPTKHLRK